MLQFFFPLYTILFCVHLTPGWTSRLLVNTTSGYYKGFSIQVDGRPVNAFLNITYGQPPVGTLRFQPPRMAPYRPTVMPSDRPAQPCHQFIDETYPGFRGTEMWNPKGVMTDHCLTLNIWTPAGASNAAVLVWIFGGGFYSGSPSLELYNGSLVAAYSGIVVVSINYRLGPFGFLYLDDDEAPPNAALLDQRLALQWLQDNLHKFGGNPAKVTIMGESAGGASVMAHLYAPGSWALFNQAIVISGTMTSPWAKVTKAKLRQYSMELGHRLGCRYDDSVEVLTCLRNISSPNEIQSAAQKMWVDAFMHFDFVPVVDDHLFFGQQGFENFVQGTTKNTAVIFGFNQDEGSYWLPTCLPQFFTNHGEGHINKTQMDRLVPLTFPFLPNEQRTKVAQYYIDTFGGSYRDALSAMVGDYYFTCNVLDVVHRLASLNRTLFLFHMNHRSTTNPWPQWMGVMHGYEMEFIFGCPLKDKQGLHSARDREISQTILDYWNSFVRYGIPVIRTPGAVRWQQYTTDNPVYVSFATDAVALKKSDPHKGCLFFKETISNSVVVHDKHPSSAVSSRRRADVVLMVSAILVTFVALFSSKM